MAKLDVDKDEGENGKEENQVPHLGEYGGVDPIWGEGSVHCSLALSAQIIVVLIKHCCDLDKLEDEAAC